MSLELDNSSMLSLLSQIKEQEKEREKRKNMTQTELQDYWVQQFAKQYKYAFGMDLDTEQLKKNYEEKMTNGDYGFTLNYYGIKSPWL